MRVRELITRLAFSADDSAAKSYEHSLRGVRNMALALASAAGTAAGAVLLLGRRTAIQGDTFAKMGVQAGMTAQQFQSVAFAMDQMAKVGDREVERSLSVINQRLGDARTAGSNYAKVFREIGFSQRQLRDGSVSTMDVLVQLNRHLKNTDPAYAARVATDLLGDRLGAKLGPAIARADSDLESLIANFHELGGGMSNEVARAAEEYTDRLGEMRLALDSIRYLIGGELLPVMTRAVIVVRDFLKENRQVIRTELTRYIRLLTGAMEGLVKAVTSAVDAVGWMRNVVELIGALIAVLASRRVLRAVAVFASGIARMGGALGLVRTVGLALVALLGKTLPLALAVLVQDIWSWVNGNDSAIERVLGKWETFEVKLRQVIDNIREMLENPWKTLFWSPVGERVGSWLSGMRGQNQAAMDRHLVGQIEDYSNRSGTIDRQSRINVTVDATINVPVGTPQSAADGFREVARRVFAEELDRQIGRSALDLQPGVP